MAAKGGGGKEDRIPEPQSFYSREPSRDVPGRL